MSTKSVQVQIANGGVLSCNSELHNATWSTQGYTFISTLKVLPIASYDMIGGIDWLARFSPMNVDWQNKWLAIPYDGSTVILQGILAPPSTECAIVTVYQLESDKVTDPSPDNSKVPDEIPTGLPPSRNCDHSIPLIAGARPFQLRPYRYPPHLKDEIETQVADMLKSFASKEEGQYLAVLRRLPPFKCSY